MARTARTFLFCLLPCASVGKRIQAVDLEGAKKAESSLVPGGLPGSPKYVPERVPTEAEYAAALETLDLNAVKADVIALLKSNKEYFWPADMGDYGPLMVRLAWHCSGSYRSTDGAGGCAGGRIRFEPERSWEDNANLDKARALLSPLKQKYGDALSWGDLMILAGTTAYRQAGAPLTKMCFGRIDEPDGQKSEVLMGGEVASFDPGHLIYVHPAGLGKDGKPDPYQSAQDIRYAFSRMGASDRATVALIGGGHTVGKTHGACPNGGGKTIRDAYAAFQKPWDGNCSVYAEDPVGKGRNTFTSGFEGYWTTEPLKWDNEFFQYLLKKPWEVHDGPAGNPQWRIRDATDPKEAMLMRLTSDIALKADYRYKRVVYEFAHDMNAFNEEFDSAWFGLTHRGSGKWSRAVKCDGDGVVPEEFMMRYDDRA